MDKLIDIVKELDWPDDAISVDQVKNSALIYRYRKGFRCIKPHKTLADDWKTATITLDQYFEARRETKEIDDDIENMLKKVFICGYEMGHNDTVESNYGDSEEVFEDYKDELIEIMGNPRG